MGLIDRVSLSIGNALAATVNSLSDDSTLRPSTSASQFRSASPSSPLAHLSGSPCGQRTFWSGLAA